jgi:competence protein ComEC
MHSFWQQMPFVRILFAFLIGVICSDILTISTEYIAIAGLLGLISLKIESRFSTKIHSPLGAGLLYFFLFICLGSLCLNLQKTRLNSQNFSTKTNQVLLVQITQKPQLTKTGWKAESAIIADLSSDLKTGNSQGKIILFGKTNPLLPSGYGNQFLIKSGIQEIVSNNNPGGFDYKTYMLRKGIYYQCFINEKNAQLYKENQGNLWMQKVFKFQDYIHFCLGQNLLGKNEIAIAEALLYGYDKEIDDEISDAYSKTGTLHVLAVSGMHVGLIFMLLSWLLTPVLNLPKGKIWVAILQLLGIWIYAVLCGLSPSILRACVMFSFVIIGKQINRSSNPFNSLSAAGFFLLILNPFMIYNVGFQLSFAAVAGILGFYPYLNLLVQFKHRFTNEIWKIIAISLAAQTLTLPISIYYFHQFPNYFLIANLIIIPLSTIIIYGGIILLLVSPIPILASWVGYGVSKLITLTSGITLFMAQLPYSSIDKIVWNAPIIVAYYLTGIALIHYFSDRNIMALKSILIIWAAIALFGLNQTYQQANTHKLSLYASNKSLVFQIHHAHTLQIWYRGKNSVQFKEKLVQPYTLCYPVNKEIWNPIDSHNYFLALNPNKHLYLLQESALPFGKNMDILFISGKKKQDLDKIIRFNNIKKVILNADVPYYKKNDYLKILRKSKIPFHDVAENGVFELLL